MLQTYDIFTYGFTTVDESITRQMLPDKNAVLIAPDCFTDLLTCSSCAIFIHAASISE